MLLWFCLKTQVNTPRVHLSYSYTNWVRIKTDRFCVLLECTAKAVIHRINNIKIKATKADATTVEGTLPASAKTPTPKRGRKVKTEADEEESPTKKTKTAAARKTKTKAPVKMEPAEDEQPKVENVTDGNN